MIRWSSLFLIFFSGVILPLSLYSVETEVLPAWQGKSEEDSAFFLGGGLWPNSALPNSGPDLAKQKQAEIRAREAARRVPRNVALIPTADLGLAEIRAEVSEQLPEITGELKDQFFKEAPTGFLIDPQWLLTEQKANDIHRFLEFHGDEARSPIYAMILGNTQKLPGDIDLKEVHRKWFGAKPAVLLAYHLENPDTIRLVFPEEYQKKLPGAVFLRIRESCLQEGNVADNASDQVEKIVVELSIQLYWLQNLLERHKNLPEVETPLVVPLPVPTFTETKSVEKAAGPIEIDLAVAMVPMSEVALVPASEVALALAEEVESAPELAEQIDLAPIEELIPQPEPSALPIPVVSTTETLVRENDQTPAVRLSSQQVRLLVGGVGLLLFGTLLFFLNLMMQRVRDQAGKPVLFPSCHHQPRLGGEFSGGAFVGVSFDLSSLNG